MSNTKKNWLERFVDAVTGNDEPSNATELLEVLEEAQKRHVMNSDALRMIRGTLEVAKLQAKDIMIPRSQMVVVKLDQPLPELLATMIDSGHSRFPVVANDLDHIKGLLLAKDLLKYYVQHEHEPFDLAKIIRPIKTVHETNRLDVLLKDFRYHRIHLALVVNEHGNLSGLVTIEDVIEQIVGDIEDEYDLDNAAKEIIPLEENTYLVDALTEISDFNEYFHTHLDNSEFDTIGGLITHRFEYLPKIGEHITIKKIHFTVHKADERRIHQLTVKKKNIKDDLVQHPPPAR